MRMSPDCVLAKLVSQGGLASSVRNLAAERPHQLPVFVFHQFLEIGDVGAWWESLNDELLVTSVTHGTPLREPLNFVFRWGLEGSFHAPSMPLPCPADPPSVPADPDAWLYTHTWNSTVPFHPLI